MIDKLSLPGPLAAMRVSVGFHEPPPMQLTPAQLRPKTPPDPNAPAGPPPTFQVTHLERIRSTLAAAKTLSANDGKSATSIASDGAGEDDDSGLNTAGGDPAASTSGPDETTSGNDANGTPVFAPVRNTTSDVQVTPGEPRSEDDTAQAAPTDGDDTKTAVFLADDTGGNGLVSLADAGSRNGISAGYAAAATPTRGTVRLDLKA